MARRSLQNAVSRTVDNTSQKFATALSPQKLYRITADVAFWYKFAATGGSIAAGDAGAIFVPLGSDPVFDRPLTETNGFLFVIRSGSTSGNANVAEAVGYSA